MAGFPSCLNRGLWKHSVLSLELSYSDIRAETFEIFYIPFIVLLFVKIPDVSFPLSNWIKQTLIYWFVNHFVHVFYKAHWYLPNSHLFGWWTWGFFAASILKSFLQKMRLHLWCRAMAASLWLCCHWSFVYNDIIMMC